MRLSPHYGSSAGIALTPEGARATQRRWMVEDTDGQLRAIASNEELRELIAQGQVTDATPIYELLPRTFADLPAEIASWKPPAADRATLPPHPVHDADASLPVNDAEASHPVHDADAPPPVHDADAPPPVHDAEAPPPVRDADAPPPVHDAKAPAPVDEEMALLDRPFEGEPEFYDEVPRSRSAKIAAAVVFLLVAGVGGYFGLRPRTRPARPAPAITAKTPAAPARLAPPPAPPPQPSPPPVAAPPDRGAPPAPPLSDPPPETVPAAALPAPAARPRARGASYDKLVASGNHLLEDGENDRAQAQFEKALAERPDGADALIGLAYVHLARGAGPKAVGLFKQVLEHDGGHAPALLGLGEAYREQGMRTAAIGAFKKFLALHPSGPDAETARRAIQDLAAGQ
jgi:hypothetical protein